MTLLLLLPNRDTDTLQQCIRTAAPEIPIQVWPTQENEESVQMVVCWNHPPGSLKTFPNLKLISSFGAGVDHILSEPNLPKNVPITRIVDPQLAKEMTQYCLGAILSHHCRFSEYQHQQILGKWQALEPQVIKSVGILGFGVLGRDLGETLVKLGFSVNTWSRNAHNTPGFHSYHGPDGLLVMAKKVDVLVNLLPLTPATHAILNKSLFSNMALGSLLINIARGDHLVERDLLEALEQGRPGTAWLDVFSQEPLSVDHPFWQHPQIHITPHAAAMTNPKAIVDQIVENYRRIQRSQPPLHQVDPQKGY